MFAFYANFKREIRSLNKPVFAVYFLTTTFWFWVSHILGGSAKLYCCLNLPLLAAPLPILKCLVLVLTLSSSTAISLYMNKFSKIGLGRKITASAAYLLFITACGCWYPMFFAKRNFGGALVLVGACIFLCLCCIKMFRKKCGMSAILMFFTLVVLCYFFFLQLCINILN